jgi:hypothetical protein
VQAVRNIEEQFDKSMGKEYKNPLISSEEKERKNTKSSINKTCAEKVAEREREQAPFAR